MKTLIDTINSKINYLNTNIDDLIYEEVSLILQQIKLSFKYGNDSDIKQNIKKLTNLVDLKNSTSSHIIPYNNVQNSPTENVESEDVVPTFGNIYHKSDISDDVENLKNSPSLFSTNISDDSYYFFNSDINYGEVDNTISLTYRITKLEDFKLFPLKISGLKLFDNIFLGRTFRESMIKLLSFLFILNEKPFIEICKNQTSEYFSNTPEKFKKPTMLKQNECYFESNVDEMEAVEVIKTFLKHINIDLSACKVLLDCSLGKDADQYVTILL